MKKTIITVLTLSWSFISLTQPVDLEWAKAIGGNNYDISQSISVDDSGNVYTIGAFHDTIDFDTGPGTHILIEEGSGAGDAFIHKLDRWGNFQWVQQIIDATAISTKIDGSGNLIIIGTFRGTVDFDPGPGISTLTTSGNNRQSYMLKLNPFGGFVWAKHFTGEYVNAERLELDGLSNIYIAGTFGGTADLDPGPGTFNITVTGGGGISNGSFFEKLDSAGNFLWGLQILEGSGLSQVKALDIDHFGNIIFTGRFRDTWTDFDPGPGTFNMVTIGSYMTFVFKLDSVGNFLWAESMGGSGILIEDDEGRGVVVDDSANIYVTGRFSNPVDFDPGPNIFTLTPYSPGPDIFVQKLDPDGNFIWAKSMGGNGDDAARLIMLDAANYLYIVGNFSSDSVDFDPGPATYQLMLEGDKPMFVLKLDPNGNFVWARKTGGAGGLTPYSADLGRSNELYFTGPFYGLVDFDPEIDTLTLQSETFTDIFITKWSQDNTSNLTLVIDSVANVSCIDSGHISAHAISGRPPYNYVWDVIPPVHDSILSIENSGVYSITVVDSLGYYQTASVIIDAPIDTVAFDLNANLIASNFRTGFSTNVWLDAFNNGCMPTTGQLSLVVSPLVQYNSATPLPDLISGDTLFWDFANLTYDSIPFQPQLFLTPVATGGLACFQLSISPISGDVNPFNNTKDYCFNILNSYDPNDKQVFPAGPCEENYILPDQVLTYTLRFQNTGNADAINIYLLDSLDTNLDLSSVKVVGNSHEPMITEVLPGNVLKFRFDNIHLPDSTSNEPASHGYVIFEVKPQTSLPIGTVIENRAGIYFDFNEVVITNTVINTLTDSLIYTQPIDVSVIQNGTTHTAQATGATYQWMDCDNGLNIPGATNNSFTPTSNGNYAVVLTQGSCTATSACYNVSTVGFEDVHIPGFLSFPNPSKGQLTVRFSQVHQQIKIEVMDVIGRRVEFYQFASQEEVELKLPEHTGLYLVRVWADGDESVVKVARE